MVEWPQEIPRTVNLFVSMLQLRLILVGPRTLKLMMMMTMMMTQCPVWLHSSRQMTERRVQVFSKHACGLPSLRDSSSPETSLRPLLEELVIFYERQITSTRKLVVDLSENNFTLDHLHYFAVWLSEKGLHLYALDLSLNRIYSATWERILPSINTLLRHVELLHLGGNYLPALQNIHILQTLQDRKVAFLAPNHSFSRNVWVEGWKRNAQLFSREAYG